jgi:ketosteroid isomerase-like protein
MEKQNRVLAFTDNSQRPSVSGSARCLALLLLMQTLLMLLPGLCQASREDDEKTVADLDSQYQEAVKKNDASTMDRILADNFILVTGRGQTFTKSDLLKEARDGSTIYEHQEDSQRTVRVFGDTAVVTALLWAKGTEKSKPFEYKLWFSDVYLRTPNGWRYTFAQASMRLPTS